MSRPLLERRPAGQTITTAGGARAWHRRLAWVLVPWLTLMAVTGLILAVWPQAPETIDLVTGLRMQRPGAELHALLTEVHSALAWPVVGHGLVMALGVLTLATLGIGVTIGRVRRWQDALRPPRMAAPRGRWLLWHRAAGWWSVALLLPLTLSGIGLAASVVLPWDAADRSRPVPSSGWRPDAATAAWAASDAARRAPELALHRVRHHDGLVEVVMRGRRGFAAGDDWHWWFDSRQRRLLHIDGPEGASVVERGLAVLYAWHSGRWAGGAALLFNLVLFTAVLAIVLSGARLWWARRGGR